MPAHHVYVDDRNFFSKYLWVDNFKSEKEARIEAFGKLESILSQITFSYSKYKMGLF